jgi:hypothetical protein
LVSNSSLRHIQQVLQCSKMTAWRIRTGDLTEDRLLGWSMTWAQQQGQQAGVAP